MERRKDLVNNTASARFIFFLPCFKLYRMEPVFRFINRAVIIRIKRRPRVWPASIGWGFGWILGGESGQELPNCLPVRRR